VWLFALLMLGKTAIVATCVADGLKAVTSPSVSVAATADDGSSTVPDDGDDDAAACWHSGSGGCHCSCAHGVALPLAVLAIEPTVFPAQAPPALRHDFVSSPQPKVLRPPIA